MDVLRCEGDGEAHRLRQHHQHARRRRLGHRLGAHRSHLPDQLTQFYDGPPPPKGNNFGSVVNPDYHRLIAQAAAKPGASGCPLWEAADAALVKHVDIAPIVSKANRYYGKGVTFEVDGSGIVPSTLRRSAG